MGIKPIPDGYRTVTPFLVVDDGAGAIDYYKQAFGAKERMRMETPDGKIGHAELEIGDSLIMLSDPFPQASTRPPNGTNGVDQTRTGMLTAVSGSFRPSVRRKVKVLIA